MVINGKEPSLHPMECYIPQDRSIPSADVAKLAKSHNLRKFVLFDEDLKIVLRSKGTVRRFEAWINDAKVHDAPIDETFEQTGDTWNLKSDICARHFFRSSVPMNNGYNNQIRFSIDYEEATKDGKAANSANGIAIEDDEEYLPSFEPISWESSLAKETEQLNLDTDEEKVDTKHIDLVYPIYSLLNMRLRNSSLRPRHSIISSLDFQTSKASIQLSKAFMPGHPFELVVQEVRYELLNKDNRIPLDPICATEIPFKCVAYDSWSFTYRLPIIPGSTPHRVSITLNYLLSVPKLQLQIPVMTNWETDVTLKRPMSSASLSQVNSAISTPRLYGISPRLNVLNSTISLVNNNSNNVRFKFVNNKVVVDKGQKFTLQLQIFNSSSSSLNMVVYYNNRVPLPGQLTSSLPLDKQFQVYKRQLKVSEGIILLSNDYKIPTIEPHETYLVGLDFIGIMSGLYSTLSGLKMIDLKTNEVIEIGQGASVFVN